MNSLTSKYLCCTAFSAFFQSLEAWQAACPDLQITSAMTRQDYDVLFKGVDADVFVPLWASSALGGPLLDETTLAVIKAYYQEGYRPIDMDGNPADYLGQQFRFLGYLYACGRAEAAADFENRFTVPTLRAFAKAVRDYEAPQEVLELVDCMERYFSGNLLSFSKDRLIWASAQMEAVQPQPPIPVEQPHIIHSAGLNNCGGKCKIDITVCEGCILQITTDTTDNSPQIRACVRGRGYRRTFLAPQRLRYPMKRVGKRGEGKFQRITWEQAAREIAQAIRYYGKEYGPESRYFIYATGNCGVMRADHMLKRLCNLDGGFLGAYNSYSSACSTYVSPYIYGDATGGNSERDVVNSKLLILWGHNPAETIFGSQRNYYLAEAKARGIPIIVIDPRMSDTALSMAEEWIPLRPSTDGALADAMAYVIVTRNLHDLTFLHRFCVGFDEQTLPEGAPRGSSYLSYLLGEADGVKKTPQWASAITGVSADTIERLAIRYATTKPAAILPGLGAQRHGNGEQGTRAIAALACLTGNVGKSGGSAGVPGFCPPRPKIAFPQGNAPYPGQIPTFLWTKAVEKGTELTPGDDGLKGVDRLQSNIKLIFNIAGNTLINQHADINRTAALLERTGLCETIVVSDLFLTPSARFADLLLPAASLLESNNITAPWANDDYLLSNSRATAPLFGAMADYDWVLLVARELGMEEAFTEGKQTTEAWLAHLYAQHRQQEPELPDYEAFREKGGHWFRNAPIKIAYRENIEEGKPFATPSGKIELFSKAIFDLHDPLLPPIPCYVPAPEGPEDALRSKYPLQLIGYHTKRRCHSIHDQNQWMEELDPPALWIHPRDASARGIENGSWVEVFNDRGRVRIRAKVTRRIMEGVTAMSQGGWYTPDKQGVDRRGSINVLTCQDKPTPLAKGNPQHTNLVQVRPAPEDKL